MRIKSKVFIFLLTILPAIVLRIAIARMMYIEGNFIETPMYIPSLLGLPVNINFYFTSYMGVFSMLFLFLILLPIIKFKKSLLVTFIFSISPINAFSDVAGTPFSFYLFFVLLITLALSYKESAWSKYVYMLSTLLVSFSSLLMTILIVPLSLILKSRLKISNKLFTKYTFLVFSLVTIISLFSQPGLKTFFLKEFSIFDDPGIVNTVNAFRGDTQGTVFALPSKLIENKYLYFGETIISNTLKHFSPSFLFTPRTKIFGFSFAPPILSTLIIPFVVFLIKSLKKNLRILNFVPIILLLIVPSIFSKYSPQVEILSMITPLLSIAIYFGMEKIKHGLFRKLVYFVAGSQFVFLVLDTFIGEGVRLLK